MSVADTSPHQKPEAIAFVVRFIAKTPNQSSTYREILTRAVNLAVSEVNRLFEPFIEIIEPLDEDMGAVDVTHDEV